LKFSFDSRIKLAPQYSKTAFTFAIRVESALIILLLYFMKILHRCKRWN